MVVKRIKTFESGRKIAKVIKLQWIASIWCQNDQNNGKLQTRSNYDKFASIWRQNYQNVEVLRKTFKTTQNYESDQIIMHCINWSSKLSKKLSYVPKLQTRSNNNEFASIWRQNDQKCWVTSQNIQNNAKLQNWSNYNELHRFDVKTIKNAKLQKQSNYDQFASIWRQNDKNFEIRRKTFKTTQNYESDQIIMNCIDWSSKRSKKLSNVPKLQKWSNYNELHRFVVKRIKTFGSGRKTTKVIK